MSETWRGPRGISLTFTRLVNPQQGHERIAQKMYGAKSGRDLNDEIGIAYELTRAGSDKRQRITGSLKDGTAFRNLAEAGEREGLWILEDEVEPDDLPSVYENNHPIHFRGAVPTRTLGAAAQVGTGATLSFADACDAGGRLVLVTGTGALAAGVLATITFAVPRQNANYGVAVWAADSDAAGAAGRSVHSDFGGRTATTWTLNAASALTASTSYHFEYFVHDRTSL